MQQQRASPHPQQVKKVSQQLKKLVQNISDDIDDLEESITAAISKHVVNDSMGQQQQQQQQQQPPRPNHAPVQQHQQQMQGFQQGAYDQQQQQQLQQMQSRDTGRQTLVRSKEPQRPVQRVPPMQCQQVPQHENIEVPGGQVEQNSMPRTAKMLIFLQNGEQRLITFILPKESCSLKEVLEQVNVPISEDTYIQCLQNTCSEIDYFVSVGSQTRIEEMLENHPMSIGDISSRSSPSVSSQRQSSEMSKAEKTQSSNTVNASPESPSGARSSAPRYVDGHLALCKSCGFTGLDFSRCQST